MTIKIKWDERPETVRLVMQSHQIKEVPWPSDADATTEPQFVCTKCGLEWPCPSIQKAEAYNQRQGSKGTEVLGNTPPAVSSEGGGPIAARRDF